MSATEHASAWPCTLHLLDALGTEGLEAQAEQVFIKVFQNGSWMFLAVFCLTARLHFDQISMNLVLGIGDCRREGWQWALCLWHGTWPKHAQTMVLVLVKHGKTYGARRCFDFAGKL